MKKARIFSVHGERRTFRQFTPDTIKKFAEDLGVEGVTEQDLLRLTNRHVPELVDEVLRFLCVDDAGIDGWADADYRTLIAGTMVAEGLGHEMFPEKGASNA